MMNVPNQFSPECAFHGELLSFLYGEMPAGRANSFREHLGSCPECGSEFAALSSLRRSIGDWKSEFDRVETPSIELPDRVPTVAGPARRDPTFLESVRTFLSGFPALAAGSLGLLAIVGGIAIYLISGSDHSEIARENGNRNTPAATPSPTAAPQTVQIPEKPIGPETAPKKANDARTVGIADKRPNRTMRTDTRKVAGNEPKRRRGANPTLLGEDDEEDDSIRLADLFDEIGTD